MEPRIRAVVFDYGNVLGAGSVEWFAGIESEFGLPRNVWRPLVAGSSGVETTMGGRPFSTADMIPELTRRLEPLLFARANAAAKRMLGLFTSPEMHVPVQPVVDIARELHRAKIRLGVLSNGPSDAETTGMRWLMESGLVASLVLSGKDGVGKPAPEAFDLILERLGVPAADAWFVDDDPGHVEAGRRSGLRSVLRDGDGEKLRRDLHDAGLTW